MLDQVIKFFVVFFVVVEPVSLLPLFVSLTEGANESWRRRMARKAVFLSGAILFVFALAGAGFLQAMGISLEAFRIFGGLLLFLIALETPWGWLAIVSPLTLAYILLGPLGIGLVERRMRKKRPEAFADYERTTSAFIPWPPRG